MIKIWHWFNIGIDRLNDLFFGFSGVLIAFMMISICYDVTMRSFGKPSVWVDELSGVAMMWVTFLALAAASRKGVHVSIDYLVAKLNQRAKAITYIIHAIVIVVISGIFFWYGTIVTWNAFAKDLHETTFLELPAGPILIAIPIGSLLLLIEYLKRTWTLIDKMRKGEKVGSEKEHRWMKKEKDKKSESIPGGST